MQSSKAVKCRQTDKWAVFRLSSLGDVALTSGVLDYWRQTRGWSFALITRPEFAGLFLHNPAVLKVEGIAAGSSAAALFRRFRRLSGEYAGWGLADLHDTLRSRMLSFLWKGPVLRYEKHAVQRRLFVRNHSQELAGSLNRFNVTQRYALAVEDCAPPRLELRPKVFLQAEEKALALASLADACQLSQAGLAKASPVAIHPFATHARKAWKREYWLDLIQRLECAGRPFFIVGQGEPLLPGDARDYTGRTGLRELCALLSQAGVLVTGDSGPMHLAVAVDTPVLALFGPTTAEWGFYPCGLRDRVLERDLPCRPCSLHGGETCRNNGKCLEDIKPEEVVEELEAYFGPDSDERKA